MAKVPRPGEVKTRLIPALSATEAAQLAECFLCDVVSTAMQIADSVVLAYGPRDGRLAMEPLLPFKLLWREQRGETLGERMHDALGYAFGKGFGTAIVIGTDSPHLPASQIRRAMDALASSECDAALVPTDDGGYSLLGIRKPCSDLFEDISWSSAGVFAATLERIMQTGMTPMILETHYDIDDIDDLVRLQREIADDPATAERGHPRTSRWILSRFPTNTEDVPD